MARKTTPMTRTSVPKAAIPNAAAASAATRRLMPRRRKGFLRSRVERNPAKTSCETSGSPSMIAVSAPTAKTLPPASMTSAGMTVLTSVKLIVTARKKACQ